MVSNVRVPDNIEELNDVGTTKKVLQNFDFSSDLLFLDRLWGQRVSLKLPMKNISYLQNFNHAFLVVLDVEAFKYLTVFSPSNLAHDFVPILVTGAAC